MNLLRALTVEALADTWYRETAHRSILSARFQHPAYQRIIALGPEVIPDLARRIERDPGHLHHALAAITGESPLPAGTPATVAEACAAWIAWARERGYAW